MTKKGLFKYFKTKQLCVLSTCNLKNKPQSAVMCLVTGDDFCFYLFTEKNTRKFHNIEDNKKIALVIGGLSNDPCAQITAQVQILNQNISKKASALILKSHPNWKRYFSPNTKFLKITPKRVQYSDFSKNIFKEFLF